MSRLAVLAAAAALLPGCVAIPKGPNGEAYRGRVSTDRVNFRHLDSDEIDRSCRSDLRVCMPAGPGMVNNVRMGLYKKVFASAVYGPGNPRDCDITFTNPSNVQDSTDVHSAYTGKFLAHIEGAFYHVAYGACHLFAEDGELFKAIPGSAVLARRNPAPAAPAAGGVSREELAQIVAQAVKQNQAPAAPAAAADRPLAKPRYSSREQEHDLAIVIGVEGYSELPKAPYAERDAEAVKAHFRALGVPERNIVHLAGAKASKSALEKNLELWLPRMVKPDSRVYFYFSGHGAPDVKNGQAYLMPWDGDPNFLDATAYPVKRLYEKLRALPAKHVLVAMDACFSGAGGRSVLASGARPLVTKVDVGAVTGKVTALTASAANEISGSLDDRQHGAFTYFFLEGLNGAAKDEQDRITVQSLHRYLTPKVQDEARRLNRDQTPQLLGADPGLQLR